MKRLLTCKRFFAFVACMAVLLSGGGLTAFAADDADYSGYTIRIYSNSNSTERVNWLVEEAKKAGFTISLDTNEVISQAASASAAKAVKPPQDNSTAIHATKAKKRLQINNRFILSSFSFYSNTAALSKIVAKKMLSRRRHNA